MKTQTQDHWSGPDGCHEDCPACADEKQHTPGPWHVERANGRYEVWPKDCGQPHTYIGTIQRAEDAKLVSAAPELLEALTSLVNGEVHISDKSNRHLSEHDPKVILARAAIAKAKGGAK